MWLCLNNAFFSIVDTTNDGNLLVRARRKGDIQRIFGKVEVTKTAGRDYLWRAYIDRETVAAVVSKQVLGINYGNFKNSVRDDDLHRAYSAFWGIHGRMQEIPPYSTVTRNAGLFGDFGEV